MLSIRFVGRNGEDSEAQLLQPTERIGSHCGREDAAKFLAQHQDPCVGCPLKGKCESTLGWYQQDRSDFLELLFGYAAHGKVKVNTTHAMLPVIQGWLREKGIRAVSVIDDAGYDGGMVRDIRFDRKQLTGFASGPPTDLEQVRGWRRLLPFARWVAAGKSIPGHKLPQHVDKFVEATKNLSGIGKALSRAIADAARARDVLGQAHVLVCSYGPEAWMVSVPASSVIREAIAGNVTWAGVQPRSDSWLAATSSGQAVVETPDPLILVQSSCNLGYGKGDQKEDNTRKARAFVEQITARQKGGEAIELPVEEGEAIRVEGPDLERHAAVLHKSDREWLEPLRDELGKSGFALQVGHFGTDHMATNEFSGARFMTGRPAPKAPAAHNQNARRWATLTSDKPETWPSWTWEDLADGEVPQGVLDSIEFEEGHGIRNLIARQRALRTPGPVVFFLLGPRAVPGIDTAFTGSMRELAELFGLEVEAFGATNEERAGAALELAAKVRELRAKGRTQAEVAAEVGRSERTVRGLERRSPLPEPPLRGTRGVLPEVANASWVTRAMVLDRLEAAVPARTVDRLLAKIRSGKVEEPKRADARRNLQLVLEAIEAIVEDTETAVARDFADSLSAVEIADARGLPLGIVAEMRPKTPLPMVEPTDAEVGQTVGDWLDGEEDEIRKAAPGIVRMFESIARDRLARVPDTG